MLVGVLKQKYLSLKYTHVQINESERSSRRQLEANLLFKFVIALFLPRTSIASLHS